MNTSTYKYKLSNGCGVTRITIAINQNGLINDNTISLVDTLDNANDSTFTLSYRNKWIRQRGKASHTASGTVDPNNSLYNNYKSYIFQVLKSDSPDDICGITLVVLDKPQYITCFDAEEEMVADGYTFNKGDRLYDAVCEIRYSDHWDGGSRRFKMYRSDNLDESSDSESSDSESSDDETSNDTPSNDTTNDTMNDTETKSARSNI
jgi:hypothetical protein